MDRNSFVGYELIGLLLVSAVPPTMTDIFPGKILNSVSASWFFILFLFPDALLPGLPLSITFCKSVPHLMFPFSLRSASPCLFSIQSSQPAYCHIIISHSSFSPLPLSLPADWQSRHAEVNWDVAEMTGSLYWFVHLQHPSQWAHRPRTHTYKAVQTHKPSQRSHREESCPCPQPSKLITLPWWSGPWKFTRPAV